MIIPFTADRVTATVPITTLLVVEDDDSIRELLAEALGFAGYRVVAERTGVTGLASARDVKPDLAILDVNLPDMDGFTVCERLRSVGVAAPVIFLTARRGREDLRAGFISGGDDYLTKPFSLEELLLRIEAILRRSRNGPVARSPNVTTGETRLRHGDLVLDTDAIRVWTAGIERALTSTEFRLLEFLLRNRGVVVSKDRIVEHVWGWDFEGDVRIVESFVSALRKKLDAPTLVRTVRSYGYVVDPLPGP